MYYSLLFGRIKPPQVANKMKPNGNVGGECLIMIADLAGISSSVLRQSDR